MLPNRFDLVRTTLRCASVVLTAVASVATAQDVDLSRATTKARKSLDWIEPDVARDGSFSPMRSFVDRYVRDGELLDRFDDSRFSELRNERRAKFLVGYRELLEEVDFDALDQAGKIDWLLMRTELDHQTGELDFRRQREAELAALLPFAPILVEFGERRRTLDPLPAKDAAAKLAELERSVAEAKKTLEGSESKPPATLLRRAFLNLDNLQATLAEWREFSAGYDPEFAWWTKAPGDAATERLEEYAQAVKQAFAGDEEADDPIVGDPIGREQLLRHLRREWIVDEPEALLEIAEREFAWCEAEYRRAAAELGFGDDWKKALDHVASKYVPPGEQPALIAKLAEESTRFVEERELVTIPALCRDSWKMDMMSPERQKVSPYFMGGPVISVSFPTAGMSHEDKLMSLRGNNVHFCRATVHHEIIPGHHLEQFMARRFNYHRMQFYTPFLIEGWALYWEMLLWDLDFAQSPEDRIGMLFWRSHRCARIVFSLKFHLGEMTAAEAVDYLVERVGHERRNAEAEVRRSVSGDFEPLYQAAYMLGGLQLRTLRAELVDSGRMTDREFHDAILRENEIPIYLIRASLAGHPLSRDQQSDWPLVVEDDGTAEAS